MKITVQQITPSVLSAQGLQALPKDLQSTDTPRKNYCLLYAAGGSFEVLLEQRRILVSESSAFLFLPNQTYAIQADPKPLQLIDIRFTLSDKAASDSSAPKVNNQTNGSISFSDYDTILSPLALTLAPQEKRALETILWELQKNFLFSQEIVDLYLKAVLLGLIRSAVEPSNPHSSDTAKRIMQYVHEHITEPLQNENAAKALSYHPNYINRVIKKATGMTFHKYVVDEKLSYAATLLLSTSSSITEIAYSLAFNTSSHFSNLFAEKYQCTPSQYRKRCQ